MRVMTARSCCVPCSLPEPSPFAPHRDTFARWAWSSRLSRSHWLPSRTGRSSNRPDSSAAFARSIGPMRWLPGNCWGRRDSSTC